MLLPKAQDTWVLSSWVTRSHTCFPWVPLQTLLPSVPWKACPQAHHWSCAVETLEEYKNEEEEEEVWGACLSRSSQLRWLPLPSRSLSMTHPFQGLQTTPSFTLSGQQCWQGLCLQTLLSSPHFVNNPFVKPLKVLVSWICHLVPVEPWQEQLALT